MAASVPADGPAAEPNVSAPAAAARPRRTTLRTRRRATNDSGMSTRGPFPLRASATRRLWRRARSGESRFASAPSSSAPTSSPRASPVALSACSAIACRRCMLTDLPAMRPARPAAAIDAAANSMGSGEPASWSQAYGNHAATASSATRARPPLAPLHSTMWRPVVRTTASIRASSRLASLGVTSVPPP